MLPRAIYFSVHFSHGPKLMEILQSDLPDRSRIQVIQAIGKVKPQGAAAALVDHMLDSSLGTRIAVAAIVNIGPSAQSEAIRLYESGNSQTASKILEQIGDEETLEHFESRGRGFPPRILRPIRKRIEDRKKRAEMLKKKGKTP